MTKQIPRGGRLSKEHIEEAQKQSLLGSAVKDREIENKILRKRKEKPKNWPCRAAPAMTNLSSIPFEKGARPLFY